MDELDRLYRRLIHNVRASFPELLARPFELSQIYQQLVPYRTNRRELGFDSNDQYELALCQLASGARGYLIGESEVQAALRRELESSNPDLASYRAYATAQLRLAPEPLRELPRRATPQSAVAGGESSWPPITTAEEATAAAARATEQVLSPSAVAPTRHTAAVPPLTAQTRAAFQPPPALPSPPPAPPAPVRATLPADPAMPPSRPTPLRAAPGQACRYCASTLPEDRAVTFCPSCGHNLTVQHCPACNTELDVDWKFCITCGRDVSAAP